jgi:hypothetical protein
MTRFDDLPNELLLEICRWIDVQTLYQCLAKLNQRFNYLAHSLCRLTLDLWPGEKSIIDESIAARVQTLTVHDDATYNLACFPDVRRLVLVNSKQDQIWQAMHNAERLETISVIAPRCFFSTFTLYEMIFSSHYPRLTHCRLTSVYSPSSELRRLSWQQSPHIRSLRISSRDPSIHTAILAACPNLQSLHLSIVTLDRTPFESHVHQQLKSLNLSIDNLVWPNDGSIWNGFFALVPQLQSLTVHRRSAIEDVLAFDWLIPILQQQLLSLQHYRFVLHVSHTPTLSVNVLTSVMNRIKENFLDRSKDIATRSIRIILAQ